MTQRLSDGELVEKLAALAKSDREANVEVVRHLAEMAARKLYLGMGYPSMWAYCREALKFSESVSQQRIVVARAIGEHPEILEMMADGRLSLCTAADLAPRLEQEGKDLLARAAGRSRKEIQAMTGAPVAARRDVIRRAPAAEPAAVPALGLVENEMPAQKLTEKSATTRAEPAMARVAFSASEEVVAKLERLQSLMGDASLEDVIGKAANLLLAKIDPLQREARREARKTAVQTPRPAKTRPRAKAKLCANANSGAKASPSKKTMPRRPPVALRDRTVVASGRRCEYVSSTGVRCAETRSLEIDHIQPYALGGTSIDRSNLRCLCRAHNQYLARRTFGALVPTVAS